MAMGVTDIVPAASEWSKPGWRKVTLTGRDDFPKHFLISTAIAAEAGRVVADVLGIYKKFDDSRGGSGFPFNDLGAYSAGTRFGESHRVRSSGRGSSCAPLQQA
jgi:hypothetical protein